MAGKFDVEFNREFDLHTNYKINIINIKFWQLKDCQVLLFCQIKMLHSLKCNLEAILTNFIPIIVSHHIYVLI